MNFNRYLYLTSVAALLFAFHLACGSPDSQENAGESSVSEDEALTRKSLRGIYLSLWSDHTGKIYFEGDTDIYKNILGDSAKEGRVLDFIAKNSVKSLSLYDMNSILTQSGGTAKLSSFLARARNLGVVEVNAVVGTQKNTLDLVAKAQRQQKLFDGVVTEIEFWNGDSSMNQFLEILTYARSLKMTTSSSQSLKIAAYIGWVDQSQIDAMVPLLDRLYVHVYVKTAANAFGYGQKRFAMIADANKRLNRSVEIRPIFSAEGNTWCARSENFMGEWLSENGIAAAEKMFDSDWAQSGLTQKYRTGYQYFSYFFMDRYLGGN